MGRCFSARFSLSFCVAVRFVIFLSVIDGDAAGDEFNVAFRKLATQISTYISPASAAVDGDNTTASCTEEKGTGPAPWWAVDLKQRYDISSVTVTAPDVAGGQYLNGLANFEVGLSNHFPREGSAVEKVLYTACGQYKGQLGVSLKMTVNCATQARPFRFVIIRSADDRTEKLCMAEVAIYGTLNSQPQQQDPNDDQQPPEVPQLPLATGAQAAPFALAYMPESRELLRLMFLLALSVVITVTVFARCTTDIAKTVFNSIRVRVRR